MSQHPHQHEAGAGPIRISRALVEWLATRQRLLEAQAIWARPESPTRVLLLSGASLNDGTCPGEVSKTFLYAN